MGKDLKGKELGVGISQRKDGLYTARFVNKQGKNVQKYFKKLQECRQWIADARFNDQQGLDNLVDITLNTWYEEWMVKVKFETIKYSTRTLYKFHYKIIQPFLGKMRIKDIRQIHCQNMFNSFKDKYAKSTINGIKVCLGLLMDSAIDNGIIEINPVKRVKCISEVKTRDRQALTINEQRIFLLGSKQYEYYNQFALILQTGLRVGELSALTWQDIDFKEKIMTVNKSLKEEESGFIVGTTKTKNGNRKIPLSDEAINILLNQKKYMDKIIKNNKVMNIKYKDFVFLTKHATPIHIVNYDQCLNYICKNINIRKISIHELRHTFATRCVENGMNPKTLQTILGHSKIETTLNIYTHVTDENMRTEFERIENMLKIV